jgi:hypothetical protein
MLYGGELSTEVLAAADGVMVATIEEVELAARAKTAT